MIHRIDIAYAARDKFAGFADRQLGWTALGMVFAAARPRSGCATTARCAGTPTPRWSSALALMVLPLVPGLGTEINGARIWIRLFGSSFQPAEVGKIALAVFFAGYLVTNRETLALAGPKVLGLQLPRVRDLGPILLAWLVSLGGAGLRARPGHLAAVLRAVRRDALPGHRAQELGGHRPRAVRRWRRAGGLAVRPRRRPGSTAWLHAFDNTVFNASPGGSGQLVRGLFGLASGGLFGTGPGPGRARTSCRSPSPTSSSPRSARSSG